MATSKTLTPTNVTIQIPEFTDQPDQRVNSNCIDKEADAINALNTNITNNNALDTWANHTTVTPSGATSYDNGCYVFKRGAFAILRLNVSGLTANTRTKIATLPTGYKPIENINLWGFGGLSYTSKAAFTITTSGEVYVISDDTYASVNAVYVPAS